MLAIINGTVYTPKQKIPNGVVLIDNSRVAAVGSAVQVAIPSGTEIYDAQGKNICPGFVDVHTHGVMGKDSMGLGLAEVIQHMPQFGVTSFMATTLTYPRDEIIEALEQMGEVLSNQPNGARALGIHLEGPHLSPKRPGMATSEWVYPLSQQDMIDFQAACDNNIRMVTFAPESPGAMDVIPYLKETNVTPVIGHSDADFDTVKKAVALGLNHATHTYNAMRPLNHRDPGVVGAVMVMDEVYAELIADGVHVHPAAMQILLRVKGLDKVVLISDSAPIAGLPDGEYEWEHKPIFIRNGMCQLENGTLAGAHRSLDAGVRNLINLLGYPLEEALVPATLSAARSVNIFDRGAIESGFWADICVLDDEYFPSATFCAGNLVWNRNA